MVALHGKETEAGDFLVEEVFEAGLPHQIERPLNTGRSHTTFVLLQFMKLLESMQLI